MKWFVVEERQIAAFIMVSAKSAIRSYSRAAKKIQFYLIIIEFSPPKQSKQTFNLIFVYVFANVRNNFSFTEGSKNGGIFVRRSKTD
jgi:hypothetical protein